MTTTPDIPRPRFARMCLKAGPRIDGRGAADHRRRLLEGLAGRVVEVGPGSGLNFAHYPATVSEVIAIEPEPTLRAEAERAATAAPVRVTVSQGTAEALPLAGGDVDAAVASLVLCSVPDQARALAEIRRVLRPDCTQAARAARLRCRGDARCPGVRPGRNGLRRLRHGHDRRRSAGVRGRQRRQGGRRSPARC
jgi:SAM-dependent methyltransferase